MALPNETTNGRRPTSLLAVLAMALAAAACSSSGATSAAGDEAAADVETVETEPESTSSSTAPDDESAGSPYEGVERRTITFQTLGGLRIETPIDIETVTEDDYIGIIDPARGNVAYVARVSSSTSGALITDVDGFVAELEEVAGAEVTETDDEMTLLGTTLRKYEVRSSPDAESVRLFPGRPPGQGGNVAWSPLPYADVWAGEVEGGVLVIGSRASEVADLVGGNQLVDAVVESLALTTADGKAAPLPEGGNEIIPITDAEPLDPMMPAADGPPALEQILAPAPAGPAQLINLGLPVTVDIPEGWFVAPNFLAFIVLTNGRTMTPGERELVFQVGTNALVGVDVGIQTNGATVPLQDLQAFLDSPPASLVVDTQPGVSVGGRDAIVFDVSVASDATCQTGDPCAFVLSSMNPAFIKEIQAGSVTRVWWIDDADPGPLVITASVPLAGAAWLETDATPVVESVAFLP